MSMSLEQWSNLSEKAQWDIKVALRGPDSYYGETLKWFTTSVIRGRVRKVFRVGGTVNSDLKLVVVSVLPHKEIREKTQWNCHHFMDHIRAAASHMGLPQLFVPEDLWHETMQMSSPIEAIDKLVKELDGSPGLAKVSPALLTELKRHRDSGRAHY